MAISYVLTDTGTLGGASLTFSITGIQAGDITFLDFSCSNNRTITDYDGWTEIYNVENTGDPDYQSRAFLLYKIATTTSISVSISFDTTAYGTYRSVTFRGSTDFDVSSNNVNTDASSFTATTIAGILPTEVVVGFFNIYDASSGPSTWGVPSGYTQVSSSYYQYTTGHYRGLMVAYKTSPSSSETPVATNETVDGNTVYLVNINSGSTGGMFLGFSF